MKRPSFQFYPSDWLRDTALRSCSVGARGFWMDLLCFMHEGNPYGVLKVGDKVILPVNLAGMVGATLQEVDGWIVELESARVFDRGDNGEIMSRRMIRDENLRTVRAEGGKKGGNPALIASGKVNLAPNLDNETEVKQKPTPSSSSSSSKFSKPTASEVDEYGATLVPPFNRGGEFVDHYEANGWKVGKTSMKDWRAAVRTWQRRQLQPQTQTRTLFDQSPRRAYD